MPIVNFIIIIILIAITAFFVASEFAIVRVRTSRIDQLIAEGNQSAITAKKVISNLDSYLSAIQLGITVTSLILGWLGEPTVQVLLNPILEKIHFPPSISSIISFIISFALITFFNVVLGELAPKSFAIQKTEEITLFVAKPLVWFNRIMFPFIWTLNKSSRLVTKLAGLKPASDSEIAPTEEELRIILSESLKSGEINQSEYKYVNNIFEFDNRIAKEIMVPRTEMVTFEKEATIDEILETAKVEKFTRYPITNGDKDSIIGIVNIKEVLTDCIFDECLEENPIEKYIKPVPKVIETVPIKGLLSKIQKDRTHMVILLDEYGGTAGLVTVEDILEEIVGEIRDEFDSDEIPLIRKINDSHYILDAKVLIEEVNDLLGTHIFDEEIDTLGGWLLTKKYDLKKGDIVEWENFEFIVSDMEQSHVQYVEVKKI
ncbi:HlyC/CorC family transporter [Bacillus sporothermodurans]|uniref:hemolysin family protein n=1 Tax=Heyndrickxia sporothermodurans TaxID=46224 RepID=UPI00192CC853|nr:hemolysin family protein [Heyndrickxia sporothermodurans]MBL5816754.1 HlyC/CorC family transporter [Heyndrickxia sporothermodurans]